MNTIHLTLTGVYAGQPLCGGERAERNIHAMYADFAAPYATEICPDCRSIWDSEDDE